MTETELTQSLKGLLAVDIGNTNITLGLWDGAQWRYEWRARTVQNKMPDEYAVLVRNLLNDAGLNFTNIREVVIASVVPPLTAAFVELAQRRVEVDPLVITARVKLGIKVDVDSPDLVGADRIVNAAAVHKLFGGPAIVIDFGTATTFDCVSIAGDYIGGAIAPGIGISLDALASRTALLHKVPLEPPPSPIGRNTTHAMQSGLFLGYLAMIEGMVAKLLEAMPATPDLPDTHTKIIATGGLAPLFEKHTRVIEVIAPYLTLDGMRLIYDLNRPAAER